MVLASVLTDGITVIENPAKEPHVDDLICFLNSCGAKIARKDGKIYCVGVKKLSGIRYKIFPDMIETLTYMVILGVCGGKIYLKCVNYEHIRYVCNLLEKMGYNLTVYNDFICAEVNDVLKGVSVKTAPYPFFPTDLHPQLSSLLCFTKNGGIIEEGIYPTRFQYVDELKKMGANIIHENGSVCVRPSRLYGAELVAPDLRAGAALICGALGAQGQSTIENVNYIVRGYENLVDKISSINGKIKLIKGE
jgi:UDP-N-acetylglucosamine 1-carboxyvinyltransferase